jgi:hypothetical protein
MHMTFETVNKASKGFKPMTAELSVSNGAQIFPGLGTVETFPRKWVARTQRENSAVRIVQARRRRSLNMATAANVGVRLPFGTVVSSR